MKLTKVAAFKESKLQSTWWRKFTPALIMWEEACQGKTFLLSVSLYFFLACLLFDVLTREMARVDVCLREGKKERESMCVCVHEGEIHYSDNESIWDNMRQFTSPVVVSSIQGEDTSPARSQRMSSSAAASLACLSIYTAAMPGSIQEHRRKCLFRSSFLI